MQDYLELFTESHKRATTARVDGKEFLEKFYEMFIGRSEEIAEKFKNTDMQRQREHLHMSLNHMIYFSIDRRASEELLRVGRMHGGANLNIRPGLYEDWLDSLLDAVKLFDGDYDQEVDLAWRVILAPGVAYMKNQYDRADTDREVAK